MDEGDGAKEPPGAALPVHVEHPQDLRDSRQQGIQLKIGEGTGRKMMGGWLPGGSGSPGWPRWRTPGSKDISGTAPLLK